MSPELLGVSVLFENLAVRPDVGEPSPAGGGRHLELDTNVIVHRGGQEVTVILSLRTGFLRLDVYDGEPIDPKLLGF
ncbi:hypothetical protein C5F59_005730 [Streptomyces sp. QL37]|uniref:hypothetical protein n=1 Tax=Streptomyces sp. QL37 TaxID=2093747 RepID=UPI000CF2B049|nr:hypothetical protein [Streptomyces sp. QL37]PPQ56251.1 hypothetical protein C5F59_05810 [Streptomyces sp. QL37]